MNSHNAMEPDLTVRSQNSNDSKDSKDSKNSKTNSSAESKHSKEILISEQQQNHAKDESNLLMFMSCAQLLLGVILVVFGVLVLVHGASLGGSGAGLWAGAGALIAGALGVVATLASSANKVAPQNSGFSTAHLAASLIALALSNMAAITALTAVVRDSQRTPQLSLLDSPDEDGSVLGVDHGWAGLLASIGLLITSVVELLISGYTCIKLAPRLCGCLKGSLPPEGQGQLKTHNMVHQWVSSHPKSQQIYLVQPMMSVQPVLQTPYGIATIPKKYPTLIPATGTFAQAPIYRSMPPGYKMARGPICSSHPHYHPQMVRIKRKRYVMPEHESMSLPSHRSKPVSPVSQPEEKQARKIETLLPSADRVDLAQTYTGLDKKMSEEFISIAMDPDRKSKASSSIGSEISSALRKSPEVSPVSKF